MLTTAASDHRAGIFGHSAVRTALSTSAGLSGVAGEACEAKRCEQAESGVDDVDVVGQTCFGRRSQGLLDQVTGG